MYQNNVKNKKSVSLHIGGRQVAMCMRDDVEVVLKPRVNVQRKELPVRCKVMYDNIITAKGRYDV